MTSDMVIAGRLTADPEIKFLPSGTPVTEVRVAVNKRLKDKETGEWKDGDVSFYTCKAFGQMAEAIGDSSLARGSLFLGVGSIEMRKWTNKDGVEVTSPEIFLNDCGASLKWPKKDGSALASSSSRPAKEPQAEYDSPPF